MKETSEQMEKIRGWIEEEIGDVQLQRTMYPDSITLLFHGWTLVLSPNGKWTWIDESGG